MQCLIIKVLTCLEKFTCTTKLFPMCEKGFAYETESSRAWKNLTCITRLFHMCKKFHMQDKIVSRGKKFHMHRKKIVSHV